MSTALHLVAYELGFIAVLAAVGSAPVSFALPHRRARIALWPVAGSAIAAIVLLSVALVLPMRVAAWAILLPLAVASLAIALFLEKDSLKQLAGEAIIPASFGALGLALADAAPIARGTLGPISLAIFDAWDYIPMDTWLQFHSSRDHVSPRSTNLVDLFGSGAATGHVRIGISVVNAAFASLFRAHPDETHLAFLATLFALIPAGIWFLARSLGAGRWASGFGAAFGLSAAIFTLVADSTLGNLYALVIAPLAVFLGIHGITTRSRRELVLGAVVVAGLVAVYPEFLTLVGTTVLLGLFLNLAWSWHEKPRDLKSIVPSLATSVGTYVLVLAVVAPVAAVRAAHYLKGLAHDSPTYALLPARSLNLRDGGAWAFGVLHLYQLPRFSLLSDEKTALAIGLPVALAIVLIAGIIGTGRRGVAEVGSPIAISIAFGLITYGRFQHGHCEYCEWKSLTFALPFIGLGLALGSQWALASLGKVGSASMAVVAVATLFVLAYADVKLVQALYRSPAFVSSAERRLASDVSQLREPRTILLEGADASAAPAFTLPATYYLLRTDDRDRISVDSPAYASAYLHSYLEPKGTYSPRYRFVFTTFPGIQNGRRLIETRGPYGLFRRTRFDVSVSQSGWAWDPTEGAGAIPWLQTTSVLSVASPIATPGSLLALLDRPQGGFDSIELRATGGRSATMRTADGEIVCANIHFKRGRNVVFADPHFLASPPVVGRATESDPVPPPPKVIGLKAVVASRLPCATSAQKYGERFWLTNGWFPPEADPQGSFRWIGTSAGALIETNGRREVLVGTASSLLHQRRLSFAVGGHVFATVTVPPIPKVQAFRVNLPASRIAQSIRITASPRAESAKRVNPADTRNLAVLIHNLRMIGTQRDRAAP
jgi:hypothetical protein